MCYAIEWMKLRPGYSLREARDGESNCECQSGDDWREHSKTPFNANDLIILFIERITASSKSKLSEPHPPEHFPETPYGVPFVLSEGRPRNRSDRSIAWDVLFSCLADNSLSKWMRRSRTANRRVANAAIVPAPQTPTASCNFGLRTLLRPRWAIISPLARVSERSCFNSRRRSNPIQKRRHRRIHGRRFHRGDENRT